LGLTQLTKTSFADNLNTKFTLTDESAHTLEVELIELREGRTTPRQDMFSITFRGPGDCLLPQGTYVFEHGTLGQFDLFIVPIGQDEQGLYYEAVFNRLLNPGG
jgi:hypothetical protein